MNNRNSGSDRDSDVSGAKTDPNSAHTDDFTGDIDQIKEEYDRDNYPLHYAILQNSPITDLDANDVLINSQDNYGNTPLHVAVFMISPNIVNYLLGQGANPNIANGIDFSPLDYTLDLYEGKKNCIDKRHDRLQQLSPDCMKLNKIYCSLNIRGGKHIHEAFKTNDSLLSSCTISGGKSRRKRKGKRTRKGRKLRSRSRSKKAKRAR
jgi:ankyrin repeat protein